MKARPVQCCWRMTQCCGIRKQGQWSKWRDKERNKENNGITICGENNITRTDYEGH